MEPRTEAEMTAILGARKLAEREKLRRQAEGMGRWGTAVTFLQVGLVYLLAMWLDGPQHTSILAATLFFIVASNIAHVNARVDALMRLLREDVNKG